MMQDIGTRVRAGRKKRVGRITIQQVAEAAQVSIGTVSRVMNGRSDVDPALSRRVEAVIRELHYQPNWRAQSLVRDKSPVVSFVLSNQGGLNPVNSLLLQGIESQCAEAGYFVLFARCEYSPETPPEDLTLPSVLLVNGLTEVIIVAGLIYDNFAEALDRRGLRWVMLANHLVSGQERLAGNRVRCDDAGGCYEASRYLIHLGHRAIWHLGDASLPWFHARHQAYQRAMRENRLEPHAQTVPLSDDAFESGHSMAAVMIEKELPVTAILADSVDLALGAIDALRQHGRDVPRDVSVIGFDYALTRAGRSHLTAVCVDAVEVGRQLARLAIGMANQSGRDVPPVVVPATLVKRSTCRPFRAEAHMVL